MPTDSALPTPEPIRDDAEVAAGAAEVELLLATDFDGTVSPIVTDPSAAFLDPAARAILVRASSDPRIRVAFISGRDAGDLRRRTEGVPAFLAGSHGLECLDPSGRCLWSPRRSFPEPDSSLVDALERSGLRVERKAFSMAVHFRETSLQGRTEIMETFINWARQERLEVIPGRKVVEARLTGGGKRAGLRALAGYLGAKRVVYAGDDTTDFAAMAFAATRGRAIFVESAERAAPDLAPLDRVAGIEELCVLFAAEIDGCLDASRAPADDAPELNAPDWRFA